MTDQLTYVVSFSGPAVKTPETLEPGSPGRTLTLEAGDWELVVRAYFPAGTLAGTGTLRVRIGAGRTVSAAIPMNLAVDTFYVKNGGDNSAGGLSPDTAFGTLSHAISKVAYGRNDIQTITVIGEISVAAEITIDKNLAIIGPAGGTGTLKRAGTYTGGPLIRVVGGAALTLGGAGGSIVIDGDNVSSVTAALALVSGTLRMYDGAVIQKNDRTGSGGGGGVEIANGGTLEMYDGAVIRGNSAPRGGGVFVGGSDDTACFTMRGGTICANTAASGGAGVWLDQGGFNLQGSGVVTDDNAVYLAGGKKITITGSLTPEANDDAGNPLYAAAVTVPDAALAGTQVLTGLFSEAPKITANSSAGNWEIDSQGKLDGPFISSFSALRTAIASAPPVFTVKVKEPFVMDASAVIEVSKDITITTGSSGGCTIKRVDTFKAAFFEIKSGGTLTLAAAPERPLVLDGGGGGYSSITSTAPLITMTAAGALVLREGAVLRNNHSNGGNGGAIRASAGTVTISGGTVTGNETTASGTWCGGVYILNHASFEMTGGVISYNSAGSGYGGGLCFYNLEPSSTVSISGGYIYGNEANNNGGGIAFNSPSRTLTLSNVYIGVDENNLIKPNKANGIGDDGGLGGGVFVHAGTVTMESGYIIGNQGRHGGGVALGTSSSTSAQFNMEGGYICLNEGYDCGGVYVYSNPGLEFDGTGAVTETAAIKANTKTAGTGGANYYANGTGVFTRGQVIVGGEGGEDDNYSWPPPMP
jgi:hypothetical protein